MFGSRAVLSHLRWFTPGKWREVSQDFLHHGVRSVARQEQHTLCSHRAQRSHCRNKEARRRCGRCTAHTYNDSVRLFHVLVGVRVVVYDAERERCFGRHDCAPTHVSQTPRREGGRREK